MKVLMLGWELPPFNSGGLGVACYQLCRSLARKDVDIEFIVPYEAEHDIDFMHVRAATELGNKAFTFPSNAYSAPYRIEDGRIVWSDAFGQQSVYELAAAQLAEELEFDIIHAHDWLTFRAALRIKQQTGKPLIVHVHSLESDRAGGQPGYSLVREIEALGFMMADKIVAVSQHTKAAIMREYGIPEDKIAVCYNSFDPDLLVGGSESENLYHYLALRKAQGYGVVASVGRLTIQKGLPQLLRAFAEVALRLPRTLLLIVGSGEQYHELIELAASLGIARQVLFAGFQRGKGCRDAFTIADVFVMPSVSEPFGLTALESVGYGTPVILSKQTGVSEILHGSLKADFWDTHELANLMAAVLQNPPLGEALLSQAQAEVANSRWANTADELLALYERHTELAAV